MIPHLAHKISPCEGDQINNSKKIPLTFLKTQRCFSIIWHTINRWWDSFKDKEYPVQYSKTNKIRNKNRQDQFWSKQLWKFFGFSSGKKNNLQTKYDNSLRKIWNGFSESFQMNNSLMSSHKIRYIIW